MSSSNHREQVLPTQHSVEQLPDFMDARSIEVYYGSMPSYVNAMSTEDLIGRANNPSYHGRNTSDDPNFPRLAGTPLSDWERGKKITDNGILELSAVRYARLNGVSDWDALHQAVLPAVDSAVQAEIRKTLFERVLRVTQPDQSNEICDKFMQTISGYSPVDATHSWQLSLGLFSKFEEIESRNVAPVVKERLVDMFVAVGAADEREFSDPFSGSGLTFPLQTAKMALVYRTQTQEVSRAGRLGKTPDLGRIARKYERIYNELGYKAPDMSASVTPTTLRLTLDSTLEAVAFGVRSGGAAARVVRSRVSEADLTQVTRRGVVSLAALSVLTGGLTGNASPASAAIRPNTSVSLQIPGAVEVAPITLNAMTVAYSALPELSGNKCKGQFAYTPAMKEASLKLIDKGGNLGNQGIVLDFFLEKCAGLNVSSGIVGNTQAESGTNPTRHQVGGPAYDAFQHEGGRLDRLMKMPGYKNLRVQCEFAWREMVDGGMVGKLLKANSPEEAAVIFEELFERAGIPRMDVRTHFARGIFKEFQTQLKSVHVSSASTARTASTAPAATRAVVDPFVALVAGLPQQPIEQLTLAPTEQPDSSSVSLVSLTTELGLAPLNPDGVTSAVDASIVTPLATTGTPSTEVAKIRLVIPKIDTSALALVGSLAMGGEAPAPNIAQVSPSSTEQPSSTANNPATSAQPNITTPVTTPVTKPAPTPEAQASPTSQPSPEVPVITMDSLASSLAAAPPTPTADNQNQAAAAIPNSLSTSETAPSSSAGTLVDGTSLSLSTDSSSSQAPSEAVALLDPTPTVPVAEASPAPPATPPATPPAPKIEKPAPKAVVRVETVQVRRAAEIQRLKASGEFNGSQAKPGAPRTPLEAKLVARGEKNGRLTDVVPLGRAWQGQSLQATAADAFLKMNVAFRHALGYNIPLNDSYRSYNRQVATKANAVANGRPQFAASPGYSKHGWGLAIDGGGQLQSFDSRAYKWMMANAINFGWNHPDFADNSSSPEPWHWEFVGTL